MSFAAHILSPIRSWYESSTIGRSNAALSQSVVRENETAKIIASRQKGVSPLDDYIWGVGKQRD